MDNSWITVYAPASIGNFGPGFDVLGAAIQALGDRVEVRATNDNQVKIVEITGEGAETLPQEAERNTASRAALLVLEALKTHTISVGGLEMKIHKGIPAGSGLGSSAASAVAGGYAANVAYGSPLPLRDILLPITQAESEASGGFFADNTASSLYGGAIICKSSHPLDIISLGGFPGLVVIAVTPKIRLRTEEMRAVLPKQVSLQDSIANMARSTTVVAALLMKNPSLLAGAFEDRLAEPVRAPFIPGFFDLRRAALEAGALGCAISGAGPTVFALTDRQDRARSIGEAMQAAFENVQLSSRLLITGIDEQGARQIST
ncbi:MAG: homoserine kinase [Candidatus Tectomicrobia bacterium]|nr:homoserine kinase [Candidatus Tectomicrobia bacterium]